MELSSYDTLNRPTNGWSQNNSSDLLRLTALAIYGESATNPKDSNFLGQLWQQYDESGKVESVGFDFKGNLLSKQQQVISSAVLKTALDNYQTYLVDWTGLPTILDTKVFETSSEFDALNRVTKIILPENVNSERKEITPAYNRAGALEKVSYNSTEYVENIAYNAKGQRLLITFGNNIMTRYAYDNRTFRLLRQRSERYSKTEVGNTITYIPQSGTTKQDDKYIYDLIGNILNIHLNTTACGVGGTNHLNKEFDYDPLYRLLSATGRENVQGSYPFPGWNDQVRGSDPNTTQAYTRKYEYDKVGNVQQIKQLGTSGFTRNFNYIAGSNKLNDVEIGMNNYNFTYDNIGNQLLDNAERHFEWDAANRLLLFKNQIGSSEPSVIAQYLYDGAGNRVKKIVRKQGGNYEIRTYIDGIFEYFTDEIEEQNTVHVMDDQSRVVTIRIGDAMGDTTPAIKYNLENNIYSSTVTLDDNGTIVNTQEYYPFGETSFGSYAKKRYQYVGKERDEESGLYYYGARYYTPWIARFISCDPLSEQYAQLSPYNYSDNNPINDYDIDGMQNNNTPKTENRTGNDPNSDAEKNYRADKVRELLKDGVKLHNIHFVYENFMDSNEDLKYSYSKETGADRIFINESSVHKGRFGRGDRFDLYSSATPPGNNTQLQVGNAPLQAGGNTSVATVIEKTTEVAKKVFETTMEVVKPVEKAASNKTVGDVVSGGGLVAQMVEVAATSTKKEIISEARKNSRTLHRNKIKRKLPGTWRKSATKLSKIKNIAKWGGRVFGVADGIINLVDFSKTLFDKDASTWKKIGAGLKLAASIASFFLRATPFGFALSIGFSVLTSWWNK